jgi:hypothetical protein
MQSLHLICIAPRVQRNAADHRERAMMHAHRIAGKRAFGKALRQRLAQLVVEARDLLRAEARGDPGTFRLGNGYT